MSNHSVWMKKKIRRGSEAKEIWSIRSSSFVHGDLKGSADTHHPYNQLTVVPTATEPRQQIRFLWVLSCVDVTSLSGSKLKIVKYGHLNDILGSL